MGKIIKEGTKIVIHVDAGQAGTDSCEFYKTSQDYTEDELADISRQCGKEHAEMYGIYPEEEYSSEEIEEDPDSYSHNIEGWFEIYEPKKHDGHRVGGDETWREI